MCAALTQTGPTISLQHASHGDMCGAQAPGRHRQFHTAVGSRLGTREPHSTSCSGTAMASELNHLSRPHCSSPAQETLLPGGHARLLPYDKHKHGSEESLHQHHTGTAHCTFHPAHRHTMSRTCITFCNPTALSLALQQCHPGGRCAAW